MQIDSEEEQMFELEDRVSIRMTREMKWEITREHIVRELNDMKANITCTICLETFKEATALGCGHIYCKICINQWHNIEKKYNCPICDATTKIKIRIYNMDALVENRKRMKKAQLKGDAMLEDRSNEPGMGIRGRISHGTTSGTSGSSGSSGSSGDGEFPVSASSQLEDWMMHSYDGTTSRVTVTVSGVPARNSDSEPELIDLTNDSDSE